MNDTGYYYTHIALLAAAMSISTGPVLELGAGFGSTLMLHGLCGSTGRKLTTLEADREWLNTFLNYGRSWHTIKHVPHFRDLPEYGERWGLAFIDHGCTGDIEMAKDRGPSVMALQNTPIIVAHDTCHPWLYGYEEAFTHFKYRWDWRIKTDGHPLTSVLSKTVDVARVFARMGL
jgi:hypothetical protein